jgi:hypothetical protein
MDPDAWLYQSDLFYVALKTGDWATVIEANRPEYFLMVGTDL